MQAGADTGKSILALDGGGVRGVISIAFLERIEALFAEKAGAPVRLADRFDLIGGTSTGAIIATALALGLSASDVKAMYFELAPRVFRRSRFRLVLVQTRFDAAALRQEIEKVVGDRRLDTPDLRTSLAIVAKRLDTGGAWIVSNNPRVEILGEPPGRPPYRQPALSASPTWCAPRPRRPTIFEPQEIAIAPGQPPGLFVDGGITPHNNPALALLQLATIPAYGYGWPAGADRLRIISIGTGARRDRMRPRHGAAGARRAARHRRAREHGHRFEQPGAHHAADARPDPYGLAAQLGGRRPRRLHPVTRAAVQLRALRRAGSTATG